MASTLSNGAGLNMTLGEQVPSHLAEDIPNLDWIWPTETPRYFAVDIFAEDTNFRVFSDEATEWYVRELTAKLKSMVPKPRNENKKSEEEVDNAAKMIQKQWKIRRDASYTVDGESRITREFGQPEDSLQVEYIGKSAIGTLMGQKSLSSLLKAAQEGEEAKVDESKPSQHDFACDLSEIKDESGRFAVNRSLVVTSKSKDIGKTLEKVQSSTSISKTGTSLHNFKAKLDEEKSYYSFASKPTTVHLKDSSVPERSNIKKKVNSIVYVPTTGGKPSTRSSITQKSANKSKTDLSVTDHENQEETQSLDDLVFRTINMDMLQYHDSNSFIETSSDRPKSQPSSVPLVPALISAATPIIKKIDYWYMSRPSKPRPAVIESNDYKYFRSLEEYCEVKVFTECTVITKISWETWTNNVWNNDLSIDVPPLNCSMNSLSAQKPNKAKREKNGRRGKEKEIEIVLTDEQESPKMITVEKQDIPRVSIIFEKKPSCELELKKIEKNEKRELKDAKMHSCKISELPLTKHSSNKKGKKECLACKHSAQKEQNKENKGSEKKPAQLFTVTEKRSSSNSKNYFSLGSNKDSTSSKKYLQNQAKTSRSPSRSVNSKSNSNLKSQSGGNRSPTFSKNDINLNLPYESNNRVGKSSSSPNLIKRVRHENTRKPLDSIENKHIGEPERQTFPYPIMAPSFQKRNSSSLHETLKLDAKFTTEISKEVKNTSIAASMAHKSVSTELSSSDIDLMMTDFSNFKLIFKSLEEHDSTRAVLSLLALLKKD